MTRTRGFSKHVGALFVVAGIPFAVLGCQNEGKSDGPPAANAQVAQAASGQPSAMKLDDATKTNILLRQIHVANQDEIELGKMALDKAQSSEVKKFANQMVTDHTAADQKLTELAKKTNLDLNATPYDPVVQAYQSAADDAKKALRGASGMQFDVGYVAPQVHMHTVALKLIDEAERTASGDAKKFLEETRPTVESHLEHAKTLQRGLIFSSSAIGGGPMGAEGAPMGSVQGGAAKGDAGHGKKSTPTPNPNQP
jgi:putative membrane protein